MAQRKSYRERMEAQALKALDSYGDMLDQVAESAETGKYETSIRVHQRLRSAIAVVSILFLIVVTLALAKIITGEDVRHFRIGLLLCSAAMFIAWVGLIIGWVAREKLWSKWPVERILADRRRFRGEAMVAENRPTWLPVALLPGALALAVIIIGSKDSADTSLFVLVLVTIWMSGMMVFFGLYGMRGRRQAIRIGRNMTTRIAETSVGTGHPDYIDGVEDLVAAGMVEPTMNSPRPSPAESVAWVSSIYPGNAFGTSSQRTRASGMIKENFPWDVVALTNQAVYYLNIAEMGHATRTNSTVDQGTTVRRASAVMLPNRIKGLFDSEVEKRTFSGLVAADPRNRRLPLSDWVRVEIKKTWFSMPKVTVHLINGEKEAFRIYKPDVDDLVSTLTSFGVAISD